MLCLLTTAHAHEIWTMATGEVCDFKGVHTRRQFLAPKVLTNRGVWGHAPLKKFENEGLGNAISCFFLENFSMQ